MTKKTLTIHSENILPIIKKWLYSDKDIFARELVSNACDAIHKVKILRDQGEAKALDDEFRIEIKIDKEKRTLSFIDTGIGMDAEEVEKYIAQIAFSSAEEFLEKYQSKDEGDQFIGHFGLGFYSAYMVADQVEINTLSYKEGAEPVFWSSDGKADYTVEKGTRTTRGTEVILHVDKNSDEFLEESRLKQILQHYCAFLPYPVYLGENHINTHEPLWIKSPSECTEKDYLEFYRYLYPMQEDPLFWVHLNVDYPFNLKGILYFPKLRRELDLNKNTVHLYCNRVFVNDNCKDIIPNYLMVLQGVIDSPDIPLNVSRSYLQMDRTVRQLSSHISKKVSDSLSSLWKSDREKYTRCWKDIAPIVKLGVLEDDKFYDRIKNLLIWKIAGGAWTTVQEYLERNQEQTKDTVIYTKDEGQMPHFVEMYNKKNVEILLAPDPIDSYVFQQLEQKLAPVKFRRIDAAVDDHLLDKGREKSVLDAEGKTEAARLADFFRSKLADQKVEVEAKSLAHDETPGFVMISEEQRRMRDYMMALNQDQEMDDVHQMALRTFVINTNSPLINRIKDLELKDPDLAKEMAQEVFELSLLSQRELAPKALNQFIHRSTAIMAKLLEVQKN
ncbi:chaperone protein htpG [Waddlia chondrophila 2032/99]|uniref:Chaperone protein htpG n=2 Tax=Waddlia chondrophila TaxID=71667 RepID=F8LC47_9BACT|nr:molecular chaperone HtpG [Waddlia chondrophila]ADI37590.1 putative chaperone protein htpG [Waddlia chondrophila WSU 86-1044]CCB91061.1 chaperone protein htpG [Waddlia chondrophila 2032/99]